MDEQQYETVEYFDQQIGSLTDRPDVLTTKPTTKIETLPLVGAAQTFIIHTFREAGKGDWIFLQHVDKKGTHRMVIPPKVADVISRQRDALTKRARSAAARAKATRGVNPFAGMTPAARKKAREKAAVTRKKKAARKKTRKG